MTEEELLGDGVLRLDFNGNWTLGQLAEFLETVRTAYGSILNFERSLDRDDLRRFRERFHFPGPVLVLPGALQQPTRLAKLDERSWAAQLALDGEPRLKTIHIASPGWLEALGKLNPLAVIADFIKWWPNRDLERQKVENEVDRGEFENELLRNKLLKERVDLLRDCGYSKREIRAALAEQIVRPLMALERFVESKEVKAEAKALPSGEPVRKPKGKSNKDSGE